ncbi:MAG: hypothetical protein CM1200mP16_09750 [Nitrospina sp.]|nr:MAG: hypothetical protein CM1200mP16_09750 [Nitrospina sp.]
MEATIDLKKYNSFIEKTDSLKKRGELIVYWLGPRREWPAVSVGSICMIYPKTDLLSGSSNWVSR